MKAWLVAFRGADSDSTGDSEPIVVVADTLADVEKSAAAYIHRRSQQGWVHIYSVASVTHLSDTTVYNDGEEVL